MIQLPMPLLKRAIPRVLRPWAWALAPAPIRLARIHDVWRRPDPIDWPNATSGNTTGIERHEYSLFSQNGEDGILRHIYSEIGYRTRSFLEFGFGLTENNSLRLVLKEHFKGLYIDGSRRTVRDFNDAAKSFGIHDVRSIAAFLTLDNLKETILQGGIHGEIDLLSIDVDGNDYWFWEALDFISPRTVVIEYNASLGPRRAWTVPYDPAFDRHEKHKSGLYGGASISALERLGRQKGYGLVGCDSSGVNAFFIRIDCLTPHSRVLPASVAYRPHRNRLQRGISKEQQFEIIKDLPHVQLS